MVSQTLRFEGREPFVVGSEPVIVGVELGCRGVSDSKSYCSWTMRSEVVGVSTLRT